MQIQSGNSLVADTRHRTKLAGVRAYWCSFAMKRT